MIVSIDMGGSKIAAATVSSKGVVSHKVVVPTPHPVSYKKVISTLFATIDTLKEDCDAVVISMPGFTNDHGAILFAGHELDSLVDHNIAADISAHTDLPCHTYNDADCFAVAEHISCGSHGMTLGVIWGSGVGFGLVRDNMIFPLGSHIELGHEPYENKTIEQVAGGIPVQRRYFHESGKKLSVRQMMDSHDSLATYAITQMIDAFTTVLATAILSFDPDRIIIGGGLSNLPIVSSLQQRVQKKLPKKIIAPSIQSYTVGDDAGLIGAAQLYFRSS